MAEIYLPEEITMERRDFYLIVRLLVCKVGGRAGAGYEEIEPLVYRNIMESLQNCSDESIVLLSNAFCDIDSLYEEFNRIREYERQSGLLYYDAVTYEDCSRYLNHRIKKINNALAATNQTRAKK